MGARYLLLAALGFCSGGILYSYYIPRWIKRIDITELSEDGNPGTYNAFKYAGTGVGILCLLADLLKGFVPLCAAAWLLGLEHPLVALVIPAPALGHACAPFSRRRGGKAVAVSFGVLLGLLPHSHVVFILAGLYVFFSLVVVLNPNERRTFWTFCLFAVCVGLGGLYTRRWQIALGCACLSGIVMFKNRAGSAIKCNAALQTAEKR